MVLMKVCACENAEYARLKRSTWTRLMWPNRRLYQCSACGAKMLVSLSEINEAEYRQRAHRFGTGARQAAGAGADPASRPPGGFGQASESSPAAAGNQPPPC